MVSQAEGCKFQRQLALFFGLRACLYLKFTTSFCDKPAKQSNGECEVRNPHWELRLILRRGLCPAVECLKAGMGSDLVNGFLF